jgi:predicted N-acyltransferase
LNYENKIWNEFKSSLEALEIKQGKRKNKRKEKEKVLTEARPKA